MTNTIDRSRVIIHVEAEMLVRKRERALERARMAQSDLIKKMPLGVDEIAIYADLTKEV